MKKHCLAALFIGMIINCFSEVIAQDLVVNNSTVKIVGKREFCQVRYRLIQKVLDNYKRAFTMLEIGANQGCYSLRTASTYDCVCVMIDGNNPHYWHNGVDLLSLCKANAELNNIILLKKAVNAKDLVHLSECEHFDIVLALNVIHRFGDRWKQVIKAVLAMGSAIIIEIPVHDSHLSTICKKVKDFLKSKKAQLLGYFPNERSDTKTEMYLVQNGKKYLRRKTWLTPKLEQNTHAVVSNFEKKFLTKKVGWPKSFYHKSTWIPGINLLTFKMLGGVYPGKKVIKKSIKALADSSHDDWIINNMIIQGDKIQLIDYDDPNRKDAPQSIRRFCAEAYQTHCQLIDLDDPVKINHFFWHILIRMPVTLHEQHQFLANFVKAGDLVFEIGPEDHERKKLYDQLGANMIAVSENIPDLEPSIRQHGMPRFCRITEGPALAILEILSSGKPTVALKFNYKYFQDTIKIVLYLQQFGYTKFNFSAREIPFLALNPWVSGQDLEKKLGEFAEKDHDKYNFWGFFYAQA